MTGAPRTSNSPSSPTGRVAPRSSTHLASKVGIAGPTLVGRSRKNSRATAEMMPQVSVMP